MKNNNKLNSLLSHNEVFFSFWCILASFGAYFSMYAFRKPFNAGTYEDIELWGLGLKTILIISQVIGYMLSKFIGIKVISELKSNQRVKAALVIISIAYISLFLFGFAPVPLKPFCLFVNGLPLGMIWGIVFSFLEGRKVTELISTGLAISIILSSGFLKTIARWLINDLNVPEFWMPFGVASMFLPLFLGFVWMLSKVPAPNIEDKANRSERTPMTNQDKINMLKKHGLELSLLVITYLLLVICRDFRDNFAIEIWKQLGVTDIKVYSQSELPIGFAIVFLLMSLIAIKNNEKALIVTHLIILGGLIVLGGSTLLFSMQIINPFTWMICLGLGMYLSYMPFQCVIFERFMATFKLVGNAGFLMYICDSSGYLGSVGILLIKEFSFKEISWVSFLSNFSYFISIVGIISIIASLYISHQKIKKLTT